MTALRIPETINLPLLLRDVSRIFSLRLKCLQEPMRRLLSELKAHPGEKIDNPRFGPANPGSKRRAIFRSQPKLTKSNRIHSNRIHEDSNELLLPLLSQVKIPALVSNQTQTPPDRSQTFISIVNSQLQPELCPRGEHSVRLVGTFADQI